MTNDQTTGREPSLPTDVPTKTGNEPMLSGAKPMCDYCKQNRAYSWCGYEEKGGYLYWLCGDCWYNINAGQLPIPTFRPASLDTHPIPADVIAAARLRRR